MLTHSVQYPALPCFLLLSLLLIAAVLDARRRRVPNAINAAVWGAGLLAQGLVHGAAAVPAALGAGLLVVAVLWLPWLKGVLGAGDVKLAAGVAVWLGFAGLPAFALATGVCGGVVAAGAYACSRRSARQSIRRNLFAVLALRVLPSIPANARSNGRVSAPYAISVAAGAAFTLCIPFMPLS